MNSRIISYDFETYFDTDYSLRKMPLEQYIRDSRFEVTMLTAHTSDDNQLYCVYGLEASRRLLQHLGYEDKSVISVAHNNRFDSTIAAWRLGLTPGYSLCSILMARVAGLDRLTKLNLDDLSSFFISKGYDIPHKGKALAAASGKHLSDIQADPVYLKDYTDYGLTDTIILSKLVPILMQLVPVDLLDMINCTLAMTHTPLLKLNPSKLHDYLVEYRKERDDKLIEVGKQIWGVDATAEKMLKVIRSTSEFAEVLGNRGVDLPKKVSPAQTATLNKKYDTLFNAASSGDSKANKNLNDFVSACLQNPLIKTTADGKFVKYAYCLSKSDLQFKELLNHPDQVVVDLVNARMEYNSSQAESRTDRLLGIANRGLLPFSLEFFSAHTGRYGGADKTNLQNLPKRSGSKILRQSIEAPSDDTIIVACDSSQVEARVLSYVANDIEMLEIFRTGGDPYAYQASSIYNVPADEIKLWAKKKLEDGLADDHPDVICHKLNVTRRNMGKEAVLASGYQMSPAAFAVRLRQSGIMLQPSQEQINNWWSGVKHELESTPIEEARMRYQEWLLEFHTEEAARINRVYRTGHPAVVNLWKRCEQVLAAMSAGNNGKFGGPNDDLFIYDGNHQIFGERVPGVMLPNGVWLLYRGLHQAHNEETGYIEYRYMSSQEESRWSYIYGGKLTENLIQALAFAVLLWQASKINKQVPIKMNVHDEWGSVIYKKDLEVVKSIYTYWMTQVPEWLTGCPLNCEFSSGANYGEC